MLTSSIVVALLCAPGIKAKTPLDEVKWLDSNYGELTKTGPVLTDVLASKAEIVPVLKAMKLDGELLQSILTNQLAEQTPKADVPATYEAVSAIVELTGAEGTHTVRLYDAKTRIDFSLLQRKNKTFVLMGAPSHASENEFEGDLLLRRSDSDEMKLKASYFVKEAGVWKKAPLPVVSQEACLERLRQPARMIAEGEAKYFAANKTYSKNFDAIGYDGEKFTVVATIKKANDTGYKAEVRMFGGVVSIDESGKVVDTKPCDLK